MKATQTLSTYLKDCLRPARFFLWSSVALYLGSMDDASEHSHHAVQLAIGLSGEFDLWIRGMNRKCRTAVIASDQPHRFSGRNGLHAIILIEPESTIAQIIKDKHCNNKESAEFAPACVTNEIESLLELLERPVDCQRSKHACNAFLKRLTGDQKEFPTKDSRIDKAMSLMRRLPDHKAPIHSLAEEVGLSESRLIHLFKEQVGIPIRRYLLWLRLVAAIEQALEGISLTTAAHNAGFADSAHLSRTFRQMFGITPSYLLKNSRFIQVISCLE